MSKAKADCEALMDAVLPVAELMLNAHGEFFPFGHAMRPDGDIVSVATFDGDAHPRSHDVIAMLKGAFVDAACRGELIATAIVYDVRVKRPEDDDKTDAIAVALDHRDDYSEIVYVPYRLDDGTPTLGARFAERGAADIFPGVSAASRAETAPDRRGTIGRRPANLLTRALSTILRRRWRRNPRP